MFRKIPEKEIIFCTFNSRFLHIYCGVIPSFGDKTYGETDKKYAPCRNMENTVCLLQQEQFQCLKLIILYQYCSSLKLSPKTVTFYVLVHSSDK